MNIRELRIKLKLTQEELSRKLKVSLATVNRWENEKHKARDITRNLREYAYLQYVAGKKLRVAIQRGELTPASNHVCRDCGKRAACYDHRDYFLPLEVEPVCTSCNGKRGVAWTTVEKLLMLDDPAELIPAEAQDLAVLDDNDGAEIRLELPAHVHKAAKLSAMQAEMRLVDWLADAIEAVCVINADKEPMVRQALNEGPRRRP